MEFLSTQKLVLHYKWIDNKKPTTFLFINSLGTDFRIWDDVAERLSAYGNILLFDKRGHGLSDVVIDTKGLNDFADDTEALLNHLEVNKCVIVGLSVGGMIAQILANRIPKKIEKLVLCDTRHKIGNEQIWNDRIAAVREKGLSSISEGVMQRWFSELFRKNESVKVTAYRNMLERCPAVGYIKTCEAIRDADLTSVAKGIKLPTLCIVGSEDKSTTPDEVRNLADLIEGARYEVIKGSGHIPCVDNPEVLSNLIIDFVNT
jgi:3-oxoadipate enol-lactonase